MEDECSIGNDETRCFILSNYATNKMNRYYTIPSPHPKVSVAFYARKVKYKVAISALDKLKRKSIH
jgi:hypothetical protein